MVSCLLSTVKGGNRLLGAPSAALPQMNFYFSCSLTGGRKDEFIYAAIVDHLLRLGHEVPTSHLARPEVMDLEQVVEPADVYRRDIAWIRSCDALIAEVSTPSHGVGYEIAVALSLAKPVLCCHRRGARVSKMITGNGSPGLTVCAYKDVVGALAAIDDFVARLPRASGAANGGPHESASLDEPPALAWP
jgi:hypothetical protein